MDNVLVGFPGKHKPFFCGDPSSISPVSGCKNMEPFIAEDAMLSSPPVILL